jgi:extracellular factor (EF) 3-hydroxypalmitic acid methyl ester biosynthesis protein
MSQTNLPRAAATPAPRSDPVDAAPVIAQAAKLATRMAALDRDFRRRGVTIPSDATKAELQSELWSFAGLMDICERVGGSQDSLKAMCRQQLGHWLFRSRHWNRAYFKPHGYPGDFRMIEWLYDLEHAQFDDPTQPAIVNCMDYLMSTVHSTRMLWERRRTFARTLSREHARHAGRLRVLDVAAGGARYVRDFLLNLESASNVEVSIVDQDASAIAFCRTRSLAPWLAQVSTHCLPIRQLGDRFREGPFDLIVCAGLLDYLPDAAAAALLLQLSSALVPGGLLSFSNFHPSDPSRLVKEWLVDWPIIYRTADACRQLLPAHLEIEVVGSSDGTLMFASGRHKGPSSTRQP